MSDKLVLQPLEELEKVSECLKVMAHPIRLRIVDILLQAEFAVHELAELCGTPPPQTCEHLRLMKRHGFLGSTRRGKAVYYYIKSEQLPILMECVRRQCD